MAVPSIMRAEAAERIRRLAVVPGPLPSVTRVSTP